MAKQGDKDDLAAALNALASGDAASDTNHGDPHDDDHDHDQSEPAPTPAPPPVVSKRPPSAPVPQRPQVSPAPRASALAPAPAPKPAPAPRARPSAPAVRSAAPVARPTPPPAAPVAPPVEDSPFDHEPPEDDDAVIVPAPDASVFAPKPKAAPTVRPKRVPVYQTLHFRQTSIPIMLTGGVLGIVLGIAKMSLSEESLFYDVPSVVAYLVIIIGLILLAGAAINIVQVKQMLEKK